MAIHGGIDRFLTRNKGKAVTIVSLGCGFEPSFFRLSQRETLPCTSLVYVDVDFERLLLRKIDFIAKSSLADLFDNPPAINKVNTSRRNGASYLPLACNLEIDGEFGKMLHRILPEIHQEGPILFLSEVALVYVEPDSCEKILRAASGFTGASLLLLEQFLPESPHQTPYGQQMLQHFDKLSSLKGTKKFPTLPSKRRMLRRTGWRDVEMQTLLEFLQTERGKQSELAQRIFRTEPFDEWEALDLFCSHYFVAYATRGNIELDERDNGEPLAPFVLQQQAETLNSDNICKRWSHSATQFKDGRILIFGGWGISPDDPNGVQQRLAHSSILSNLDSDFSEKRLRCPIEPEARLHHTCTAVPDGAVLFGGRQGPLKPFSDLWHFDSDTQLWTQLKTKTSSPVARYRHAAVFVKPHLLIHGGIDAKGKILSDAWSFSVETKEWSELDCGAKIGARFSHRIVALNRDTLFMLGGLNNDFQIPVADIATLLHISPTTATVSLRSFESIDLAAKNTHSLVQSISRYNAEIVALPDANQVLICGGVCRHGHLTTSHQFLLLDTRSGQIQEITNYAGPPRMLVDHRVVCTKTKAGFQVTIIGGGTDCFSFGSRFDKGILRLGTQALPVRPPSAKVAPIPAIRPAHGQTIETTPLPELPCSREAWLKLMKIQRPSVFRGCDIGGCGELWNTEYLREKRGETKISVHVAKSDSLQWHDRNFAYEITTMAHFLKRVEAAPETKETLYLRSLAGSAKRPANFKTDFPEIANDFQLPDFCKAEIEQGLFSQPLRLSTKDMAMWAHYDTADNVLVQVVGSKRVRLWNPRDADKLYIKGSSSQIPDPFQPDFERFPLFKGVHSFDVVLKPGDMLYIPSTWIHAVQALEMSISTNVFFRNQDAALFQPKDVFGNADLVPFVDAQRSVKESLVHLDSLRDDQRRFYLIKLAMDLIEEANL